VWLELLVLRLFRPGKEGEDSPGRHRYVRGLWRVALDEFIEGCAGQPDPITIEGERCQRWLRPGLLVRIEVEGPPRPALPPSGQLSWKQSLPVSVEHLVVDMDAVLRHVGTEGENNPAAPKDMLLQALHFRLREPGDVAKIDAIEVFQLRLAGITELSGADLLGSNRRTAGDRAFLEGVQSVQQILRGLVVAFTNVRLAIDYQHRHGLANRQDNAARVVEVERIVVDDSLNHVIAGFLERIGETDGLLPALEPKRLGVVIGHGQR